MKIIDAHWEKRNLGVDSVEFEIENTDCETIINEILINEKQYNVVKLPSLMPKLLMPIQEQGYRFVESSIEVTLVLKDFRLPDEWLRFVDKVENICMDKSDIIQCFAEIEGGMFNSDRIYNDPRFGAKQSSIRYINWMRDEIDRGSLPYKFVYNEEPIGFYLLKDKGNKIYDAVLGGVYNKWLGQPLAVNLVYQHIQEARRLQYKKFTTHLSSNNSKSFRLYMSCGCVINEINHVFVKHKD